MNNCNMKVNDESMKYFNKIYQFMRYRYGIDELYKLLIYLYISIAIINIFISSRILTLIELILFLFTFYRVFSKNISKRRKENEIYLRLRKKVTQPFLIIKKNYQDREYHVYRKCHHCKTILKLPLPDKRGIKHVKCPKCKKDNTVFILRKQKIEVIKKKGK